MFHDVSLLESAVELGRLITFYFDAGVGFLIFMGTLRSVLFRIISKYFPFLRGVSRSMQKSCYYAPVVILPEILLLLLIIIPDRFPCPHTMLIIGWWYSSP